MEQKENDVCVFPSIKAVTKCSWEWTKCESVINIKHPPSSLHLQGKLWWWQYHAVEMFFLKRWAGLTALTSLLNHYLLLAQVCSINFAYWLGKIQSKKKCLSGFVSLFTLYLDYFDMFIIAQNIRASRFPWLHNNNNNNIYLSRPDLQFHF